MGDAVGDEGEGEGVVGDVVGMGMGTRDSSPPVSQQGGQGGSPMPPTPFFARQEMINGANARYVV